LGIGDRKILLEIGHENAFEIVKHGQHRIEGDQEGDRQDGLPLLAGLGLLVHLI